MSDHYTNKKILKKHLTNENKRIIMNLSKEREINKMEKKKNDWKEEMRMGMQMIRSACNQNNESCDGCPFERYCTLFEYDINLCPSDWEIKDED